MPKLPPRLTALKTDLRPDRRRLFWVFLFAIPPLLITAALIAVVVTFSSTLPSLEQLEAIEPRLVTKLYDKEEGLVREFFIEKRLWTPIDSIPQSIPRAVMASEDRSFESHWGVNIWAMPKTVIEKVVRGKRLRGASTLSQQLAKNLFLTPERSLSRKIKEALTAIAIERTYTKQEIMEFYLNLVYLGAGNYGFQAASQYYFGTPLDRFPPPKQRSWSLFSLHRNSAVQIVSPTRQIAGAR